MSEVQKPVDETPVTVPAPVEAAPVVETVAEPKIEEGGAPAVVAAETPVEPTVAPTEDAAAVKDEVATKEFAGEGILAYKAPGGFIKKLAGFQKRFFWLGSEAVEPKHLSSYLRGEKPEVGNHNAAWSSQTGKGLLYFSKQVSEKATPVGIINLKDISEITEEGSMEFHFLYHGQKHAFQATSVSERDSWVAALKTGQTTAQESAEGITSSEGYKEHHSNLAKGAGLAGAAGATAVAATKVVESKKEDVKEKKEEKKEELKEKKEEKKDEKKEKKEKKEEEKKARTKSRSASRKRNSIFGGFGLGKKDEEKTAEATPAVEPTPAVVEPVEAAPVVAAPVVSEHVPEPVAAPVEPVAAEAPVTTPTETKANKRNSIFGGLSRFTSKKSSTETETLATTTANDETAAEPIVAAEAPVIPEPEVQSEPLAAGISSPATVPTETVTVPETTEAAVEAEPETKTESKTEKRKSSMPFFSRLRQTVKGKSSPKAETAATAEKEAAVEKPEEPTKTVEVPAVPAVAEPAKPEEETLTMAAPIATSTPTVSATA